MTDALEQLAEIPEALQQFQEPEQPAEPEKAEEPEATPAEEVKADPLVEKAKSMGWKPKDEWHGDPDEHVDAGEFIRRKPLFDQIHQLKKEVKSRAEQIEKVSEYAARAAEKARKQLLEELEAKKREAFQNADYDAFAEADAELKKAELQPEQPTEPAAPEIPPELQEFTARNERWFDKDRAMTAFALAEAERLKATGMPFGEMLKQVEQEVRKEFAHKFTNPNKEKAPAVVPDGGEKVTKGKIGFNDLTRDERAVWNAVKQHMTFEEFIKDLR